MGTSRNMEEIPHVPHFLSWPFGFHLLLQEYNPPLPMSFSLVLGEQLGH